MKIRHTAREFLDMSDRNGITHEKLLQFLMGLYGLGVATTDFENNEPVVSIDAGDFLKFASELVGDDHK